MILTNCHEPIYHRPYSEIPREFVHKEVPFFFFFLIIVLIEFSDPRKIREDNDHNDKANKEAAGNKKRSKKAK